MLGKFKVLSSVTVIASINKIKYWEVEIVYRRHSKALSWKKKYYLDKQKLIRQMYVMHFSSKEAHEVFLVIEIWIYNKGSHFATGYC